MLFPLKISWAIIHHDKWVRNKRIAKKIMNCGFPWSFIAVALLICQEENSNMNHTLSIAKPELGEEDGQENKHKVMLCTEPTLDTRVLLANSLPESRLAESSLLSHLFPSLWLYCAPAFTFTWHKNHDRRLRKSIPFVIIKSSTGTSSLRCGSGMVRIWCWRSDWASYKHHT